MRLGLCGPPEQASLAHRAGCDYIELSFCTVAQQSDDDFARDAALLESAGLRAEAMNRFLTGAFPLCALQAYAPLEAYIRQGMGRAKSLGTQVVVFGSSGARKLPQGISKREGWQLLLPAIRLAGDIAAEYGITIAMEPLRVAEDNALNTVEEGLELLALAGHPNVCLLADLYHVIQNEEGFAGVLKAGAQLRHCHIASPDRTYPMPEDGYDYKPFAEALRQIGYSGRVSIEARPPSDAEDLLASLAFLRKHPFS